MLFILFFTEVLCGLQPAAILFDNNGFHHFPFLSSNYLFHCYTKEWIWMIVISLQIFNKKKKAHSLLKKQMTSIEQYLILFCVFLYLFRIFSQNFSYFVFVPVVVDFSLFFWVIHWCNKELSCRASVLRDVSNWILPAFSKFGQHQLLRWISRWINNLVPRVLSYSAPVVTGAELERTLGKRLVDQSHLETAQYFEWITTTMNV